ncbi:MAG: envelope stress response membrane protein PspB [Pseudomonadota bacterium]
MVEEIVHSMTVIMIIFTIFVGCPWIFLHYRTLQKKSGGLTREEHEELEDLKEKAIDLHQRIETLESILDSESPGWRDEHEVQ